MVQYQTHVDWDATLRDLMYLDDSLNSLIISGVKITTGAPVATAGFFARGCLLKNIFDGTIYQNTGTTATPVWTLNGTGVPGITQLTGDITAGPGSGSVATTLANTAVVPAAYTYANITVDSKGRITAAASGTPVFTGTPDTITATGTVAITEDTQSISGTGITAAGQDMTTTNTTFVAGLNEFAGCWLVSTSTPATPPVLILSNTAAASQAIVFTVAGAAFTEAGNWQISAKAATFTGSAVAYTPAGSIA